MSKLSAFIALGCASCTTIAPLQNVDVVNGNPVAHDSLGNSIPNKNLDFTQPIRVKAAALFNLPDFQGIVKVISRRSIWDEEDNTIIYSSKYGNGVSVLDPHLVVTNYHTVHTIDGKPIKDITVCRIYNSDDCVDPLHAYIVAEPELTDNVDLSSASLDFTSKDWTLLYVPQSLNTNPYTESEISLNGQLSVGEKLHIMGNSGKGYFQWTICDSQHKYVTPNNSIIAIDCPKIYELGNSGSAASTISDDGHRSLKGIFSNFSSPDGTAQEVGFLTPFSAFYEQVEKFKDHLEKCESLTDLASGKKIGTTLECKNDIIMTSNSLTITRFATCATIHDTKENIAPVPDTCVQKKLAAFTPPTPQ